MHSPSLRIGFLCTLSVLFWIWGNRSVSTLTPRLETDPPLIPSLVSGWSSWLAHAHWFARIDSHQLGHTMSRVPELKRILSYAPANRFFRIQAAGIIAFDEPSTRDGPGSQRGASTVALALAILRDGFHHDPGGSAFYHYEIGKIQLVQQQNTEAAIAAFRAAAGTPAEPITPPQQIRPPPESSGYCVPGQ